MPLSDYSHWNEEAARVWWEEEGRHPEEPEPDEFDVMYDRERYEDQDAGEGEDE